MLECPGQIKVNKTTSGGIDNTDGIWNKLSSIMRIPFWFQSDYFFTGNGWLKNYYGIIWICYQLTGFSQLHRLAILIFDNIIHNSGIYRKQRFYSNPIYIFEEFAVDLVFIID